MGEVYRARDTRLDRAVALKVLPADVAADPERLARFEREARAAPRSIIPNIVTIYDVGDRGAAVGSAWSSSRARRCARCSQRGPLPLRRALTIARADRRRPRRGARRRHRPSRSQARERDGDRRGLRQDPRLRPRASWPIDEARRAKPRRDLAGDTRPGTCWARSATCRPSRPAARPSTSAPISSRSASCSTRC